MRITGVSKHYYGKWQQRRNKALRKKAHRRNISQRRKQAHGLWKPY